MDESGIHDGAPVVAVAGSQPRTTLSHTRGLTLHGGCRCKGSLIAGRPDNQAALTSIFLAGFCASAVFGSITLRTPFLKEASILSASTPSGRPK